MALTKKIVSSFDEISVPKILYKYRDWNDKNHVQILKERKIYLPSPESFDDEFDCKIPIRYDLLCDKEIYQKYLKDSKRDNPQYPRQHHRAIARKLSKKRLLKDTNDIVEKENQVWKIFNNQFGVLCLTEYPNNYEMWEKYANQHKGFCVGFTGEEFLSNPSKIGAGGEVVYYDELPIIHPLDDFIEQAIVNIYSKLRKWEFEKEYRTHKTSFDITDEWRKVEVEENIFVELIFGALMPINQRVEIMDLIKGKFSNLVLKEAILNENEKSVELKNLNIN